MVNETLRFSRKDIICGYRSESCGVQPIDTSCYTGLSMWSHKIVADLIQFFVGDMVPPKKKYLKSASVNEEAKINGNHWI